MIQVKSIMLPQNIIVENCYGNIHIYIHKKVIEINNNEYSLKINERNLIKSLNKVIEIEC